MSDDTREFLLFFSFLISSLFPKCWLLLNSSLMIWFFLSSSSVSKILVPGGSKGEMLESFFLSL